MKHIQLLIIVILLWSLIGSSSAIAADGDIDTTYGTNGIAVLSGYSNAIDIAIQADKAVVLFSYGNDFGVLRFNSDGSLDTTFGTNGLAVIDFQGHSSIETQDTPNTILIQSDGKILVGGSTKVQRFRVRANFALARLTRDGLMDITFSTDGLVVTDFSNGDDVIYDLAVQANDKIIAVGQATTGNKVKFGAARYLSDGTLDPNFAQGGIKSFGFGGGSNIAYGVAVQDDGKILVTGRADLDDGNGNIRAQSALARLRSRGKFDHTFGTNGKTTSAYYYTDGVTILDSWAGRPAIQGDGKIVVTGFYSVGKQFGIARYDSDGSPDTAFGSGGKVVLIGVGAYPEGVNRRIALDGGNIISGGWAYSNAVFPACNPTVVLFRYDSTGTADSTFGGDGVVQYFPPFLNPNSCATGLSGESFALQSDGKIVTAGDSNDGSVSGLTLARFYN